jgi:dTDP-glucose pyrophosphorylase/predicted transcriptional regulator
VKNINIYMINSNESIRACFRKMDLNKKKFIMVVDDNNKIIGLVTDGDIRREIWKGTPLSNNIKKIMNTKYISSSLLKDPIEIKEHFSSTNIKQIPVIDENKLIDIIFEDEFDEFEEVDKENKLSQPLVIMAGGKGTRLDPFTKILPKALIPIGEKPITEAIIDNFHQYGVSDFYISVNHKARMIKAYFEDFTVGYNIRYITEEKPLGTAGSLRLLLGVNSESVFVSNCDIIIRHDYRKIYKFHKDEKYAITIVASMQHISVPYGVCEISVGGDLIEVKEKPEYDVLVNTGMYIINTNIFKYIPEDKYMDMTELIGKASKNGHRVGVYPISEKSWLDVGQWEKFDEAVKNY